jgi:putative FmdB family regulatory protein
MPIYAYKCSSCGHANDVMRKIADAPLTTCPTCGAETYAKQVTAPSFALKGSGWYATDFKNNGSKPAAATTTATETKTETSTGDAAASPATTPTAAPAVTATPAASATKAEPAGHVHSASCNH